MLKDLRVKEYTKDEARMLNPLQLALIGDGVYEIFIRNYILCNNENLLVHKMHKSAIGFVKAKSQSQAIQSLKEELLEEELYIFKRGRNAKSHTVPKNAELIDYKMATGFESLVGYLYLTGNQERLNYIMNKSVEIIKSKA